MSKGYKNFDDYYDQIIPLDFWPTAVIHHKGALIVAGNNMPDANTRLERLELAYAPLAKNARSYSASLSSETIYGADIPGRRSIRTMSKLLGTPNSKGQLLVQFEDSKDLYQLHLGTRELKLLVSAEELPSLMDRKRIYVVAAEVQDIGYIYFFYGPDLEPDRPVPVLVDSDKNGSIDRWHECSWDEFNALYGPNSDWLNYHENRNF